MQVYQTPRDDFLFVLSELLVVDGQTDLPRYSEVTPDIVRAFIDGAGKICEQVALPLNQTGDEGSLWDDGEVYTPKGFREAYHHFASNGWIGLPFDETYNGKNLPAVLSEAFYEILCATNLAFSGFIELSEAVFAAIHAHGDESQRSQFLPKMGSGEWAGAMHLTEAQAGSDLSLVKTRAEAQPNGTFRLFGTKSFITNAEHDLTENIVNLVLARTPDAPEGTRGLSLFIVPKFLVGEGGEIGPRNNLRCNSLEKKMGLRSAPTGVIEYSGAEGYLLGQEHGGIDAMFTMVNDARLGVGIQGLGIAEIAYQSATAYARDRVQGRVLGTNDRSPQPIIAHADVRRMLMTMRSFVEAARALALWMAMQIDVSKSHPDAEERRRAGAMAALMTPVIKAHFTDWGSDVANLAVQCCGGYGYIRDSGIEQFVRDVRVTQIYEGTNGIQALDLLRRKIYLLDGQAPNIFFAEVKLAIENCRSVADLEFVVDELDPALGHLRAATKWLQERTGSRIVEAAPGAVDYLRLFGLVSLGWMWARISIAASGGSRRHELSKGFYDNKLIMARFFMRRFLPESELLRRRISLGSEDVAAFRDEDF
jgi:alkylation response protein AidB-like acyl-CoA dehydrogenase